jgi:hypothetical protein
MNERVSTPKPRGRISRSGRINANGGGFDQCGFQYRKYFRYTLYIFTFWPPDLQCRASLLRLGTFEENSSIHYHKQAHQRERQRKDKYICSYAKKRVRSVLTKQ